MRRWTLRVITVLLAALMIFAVFQITPLVQVIRYGALRGLVYSAVILSPFLGVKTGQMIFGPWEIYLS